MDMKFTLNYWIDDGWYVGKLKEVPGVFSQGETMEELITNIQDAYSLVMEDNPTPPFAGKVETTEVHLNVA